MPDRLGVLLLSASGLVAAWQPLLQLSAAAAAADAQVQLRCNGALIEARGIAQVKRATSRLVVSLGLEAAADDADGALASLQQRLVAVRAALQRLEVGALQVSSPSTWNRPAERNRPAGVEAGLQISGELAARHLQALIRQVGSLPGVRLAPVSPQADTRGDALVRRQLLRAAFADARSQAEDLAGVAGLRRLVPIELGLNGVDRPVALRAMAAPDGFNPEELPAPTDRLEVLVKFCAS